jgi:transcription initiation factor TFIIIB Brf1 subunit/transcription initiation factor TFIIB
MPKTPRFHAFVGAKPPRFANDAERDCAQILDFHGIPWDYEPRTFALELDAEGTVVEAFTPDFYLRDQDLYLEITTMKQSLVTKKNRKMRRLRELHPGIRVKLFYKRDIEALAAKYELDVAPQQVA